MTQMSQLPMFGPLDSHVKTSRWLEWGQGLGFEGANLDSFMSLCGSLEGAAQELLSSRTCMAFSLATEGETSPSYSRRWMNSGMTSLGYGNG